MIERALWPGMFLVLCMLARVAVAYPPIDDSVEVSDTQGWKDLAWGTGPRPEMRYIGGNGPERKQYRIYDDPRRIFGIAVADAVTYEFVDGRLATVLVATRSRAAGEAVFDEVVQAHGPPTSEGPYVWTWVSPQLRIVVRQQRTDLWVISWSWLPLHRLDPGS